MKKLMSGNEAIARGAWEAGCTVACAYPGTPSTEILQYISDYPEVDAEWSPNEKVALEVGSGAAFPKPKIPWAARTLAPANVTSSPDVVEMSAPVSEPSAMSAASTSPASSLT